MEPRNPVQQAVPAEEPASRPRLGLEPGADEYAKWSHQALGGLLEISNLVGSDLSLEAILARIVRLTAESMGTPTSSIYLWNDARDRVVMRANIGFEPELIGVAGFEAGRGIPGWVAVNGELLALADAKADPRYDPLPTTLEHDFRAYLCAPLRIRDEIIGAMTVRRDEIKAFTADEVTLYETICKQVAILIEKARMRSEKIEAEKLAAVAVSLSGVAHYIKNVLLAMAGGEYLIDTGLKRGNLDQTRDGWRVLRRSSRKIRDLVENMLNYYRESELHPRPIELNSLLLEVLQSLEERAIDGNTILTPDLDLRLEEVELDPDAIHDIMINLVTNAIDAIPKGVKGLVRVQTRLDEENGRVLIAVTDNGDGIAPENRDKLFHLFFSTKGKQGTGIGLAATRRLILEHGGSIDFESELGHGTTFTVLLPLRQSTA